MECQKSFPSLPTLQRHVKSHKANKKAVAKCSLCGLVFKRKSQLKAHKVKGCDTNAALKSPTPCTQCDLDFASKAELNQHMKSHHPEKGALQCRYCEYIASTAEYR